MHAVPGAIDVVSQVVATNKTRQRKNKEQAESHCVEFPFLTVNFSRGFLLQAHGYVADAEIQEQPFAQPRGSHMGPDCVKPLKYL
jgi:hypothetical protein